MEKPEGDDEAERPENKKEDQRERAEHREKILSSRSRGDALRGGAPWRPEQEVEAPRQAELSRNAAREDDGLKCVPQDDEDEKSCDGDGPKTHGGWILGVVFGRRDRADPRVHGRVVEVCNSPLVRSNHASRRGSADRSLLEEGARRA